MTRITSVAVPGRPHLVTQRGNRRQKSFFEVDDYRTCMAPPRAHVPNPAWQRVVRKLEKTLALGRAGGISLVSPGMNELSVQRRNSAFSAGPEKPRSENHDPNQAFFQTWVSHRN